METKNMLTQEEVDLVMRIARRYVLVRKSSSSWAAMVVYLYVRRWHCRVHRLDLEKLVNADDTTFMHDIEGIFAHLEVGSYRVIGEFVPRCIYVDNYGQA